ncbi:hypothetical protein RISK_006539 [Rhodopirellula islandica]|uniref:Uncharacterized protein n=1 Tax=Rhodopirellula islandica TaxID=595434 RepID=A0A0J1B465_RHOIS|nr:hypothetical protein RISK_006539 [Rhodopirellula islandica]
MHPFMDECWVSNGLDEQPAHRLAISRWTLARTAENLVS